MRECQCTFYPISTNQPRPVPATYLPGLRRALSISSRLLVMPTTRRLFISLSPSIRVRSWFTRASYAAPAADWSVLPNGMMREMERETRSKDMEVHVEGDSQQDANTQTSWLADGIYFINNNDIEVTEVAMLLPGILGILEVGSATFVYLIHCTI